MEAVHETTTERLRREVHKLWTLQDVTSFFGVTQMTILNWCSNPPFGRDPLPVVNIPNNKRNSPRFAPDDVKEWAKQYGVKTYSVRIRR